MHYLFKITLLLLLTYSWSNADTHARIIITKTDKQSALSSIKQRLDALHVKMYIEKKESYSVVYSPEYDNLQTANSVLEKLRKDFPYAKIVYAENSAQEKQNEQNSSDFFISLSSGMANLSNDSDSTESGVSYSGAVGYMYTPNLFSTLVYSNTPTDNIDMYSIYTSLNYKFNLSTDFALYAGGIVGYSSLELSNYEESSPSTNIIYGVQLGSSYSLSRYFSLFGEYRAIGLNHSVTVDSSTELKVTLLQNVEFGVMFKF